VVSFTARLRYLLKTVPVIRFAGGWAGPRGVLNAMEKRKSPLALSEIEHRFLDPEVLVAIPTLLTRVLICIPL
jgi:hypothetical protein